MKLLKRINEINYNKKINFKNFYLSFTDYLFIFSFLIFNILALLVILPPYSHVDYGTQIYEFKSTNMHEFDDKLFYLLSFAILPILSIFLLNSKYYEKIIFISVVTVLTVLIFFFIKALTLIYFFYIKDMTYSLGHYYFFYCALLFEGFIYFWINQKSRLKFLKLYRENKDKFLFFFIILSLILIKFYSPFTYKEIKFLTHFKDFKFFFSDIKYTLFFFLILTIFYILFKYEKNYQNKNNYNYFALTILIITIVLHFFYFDVSGEINMHHYAPVFGPAAQTKLSSGVSGIDAHSQYGYLFFIILNYLFNFFPITMGTTSLLINFVNLFTLVCFVMIFFQISKNKILSLLVATLFVAYHYKTAAANFISFPSLLGTRNLIPLISLYFLLKLNHKFIFDKKILFIICLSSVTSFEVFIYSSLPYLSLIFFVKIADRKFNDLFRIYLKIFITILIFHALINLIFFIKFNQTINYMIYFEILKSMTISRWWPIPTLNLFLLPYTYYLIYGVTLIYCYHVLIEIWNSKSLSKNFNKFKIFYSLSSLGILMMIYYVSRSVPSNLQVASLPMYILIYIIFENLYSDHLNKDVKIKFIFSLIIFYFIFSSSLWISSPVGSYRNGATFLKKCISQQNGCNFQEEVQKIVNKKHNYPKNSEYYKIIKESDKLIKNFFKNENEILFFSSFHDSAIPEVVLSSNKKWHFHPSSFVSSDELSDTKISKLIVKNQELKEGMPILILNKYKIHRLEQLILNKIKDNWNLCAFKIDSQYYKFYKLSSYECKSK